MQLEPEDFGLAYEELTPLPDYGLERPSDHVLEGLACSAPACYQCTYDYDCN